MGQPSPEPAPTGARLADAGAAGRTILVVEDQDALRRLAVLILEAAGYAVVAAADGDEALALVAARGQAFDLVMSDVVLPGLDGRELAERLIAMHPQMPILLTSGHSAAAIARDGAIPEGIHFLAKPYAAADLRERVRSLIESPRSPGSDPGRRGRDPV